MLFYPYFLLFILADAQIGEETLILRRNIERYLLKFFKNRILIAKIWEFRENLLYSVHLLLGGHALPLQDEPQQLPNLPADYMGISKSYLYKLTSAKKISFYKPKGKMIYFSREELESYLLQNPAKTADEIEAEAEQYLIKNKKR